jgi:hypothetical protein
VNQPDPAPPVPPEGMLLRRAREGRRGRKMSMRAASVAADVSETTWRHAEAGSEPKGSLRLPYRVGDATLARMALTVGVTSAELREARRPDAADLLEEMDKRPDETLIPECELELRILRSDILSDDQKKRFIRAHRAEEPAHRWCRFADERAEDGTAQASLRDAALPA